jgi:hypothetical protein
VYLFIFSYIRVIQGTRLLEASFVEWVVWTLHSGEHEGEGTHDVRVNHRVDMF